MNIVIRADGSNYRGMGHISKQISLYKKLRSFGHELLFITMYDENTINILNKHDINYVSFEGSKFYNISKFIDSFIPDIIVLDILDTSVDYINSLKICSSKIITFDNTDESSFMCDMIFNVMYYHNTQLKKKYENFNMLYEGHKYIIMDEKYNSASYLVNNDVRNILLTQGGADTSEKIPFLLNILLSLKNEFNIEIIIGPAFSKDNVSKIENIAKENTNVNLNYKPNGLFELIKKSDLVITAGGTTMWEIAALKTPMYIYINEEFEDETATIIKELRFAYYNGFNPNECDVLNNLKEIILNFDIRNQLHNNMKKYNVANGINMVTDLIDKGFKNV